MSAQRLSGNFSGGDILPISSCDLVALDERGERVRNRHLAGLVALQPHFFEDLGATEAPSLFDDREQLITPAAATGAAGSSASTGAAGRDLPRRRLPALRRLIGFDRGKLPVYRFELLFKLLLLGKNGFPLTIEACPLTLNECLECFVRHPHSPSWIGDLVAYSRKRAKQTSSRPYRKLCCRSQQLR